MQLNIIESLFEKELLQEIGKVGSVHSFEKNDIIMDIGQRVTHMPILLEGSIKIMREDEEGKELLLYYMEPKESCVVTLKCCTTHHRSQVRAIAEEDTELLFIPVEYMEQWMVQYTSWRNFILDNYSKRFNDMLEAVDNLAFMNVEERIIKYLENKSAVQKTPILDVSHQDIATEINSSRVVVSRIMKKLEQKGLIEQGRNNITLVY